MRRIRIIEDNDDNVKKESDWFPNLRALRLRHLPKLTGICRGGLLGKDFVEQIVVEYCPEIKQIFMSSCIPHHHLRNLREVKVAGCQNLREMMIASPHSQSQSL